MWGHVIHICLPDKHNFASHFCLQVFLSEQSFPIFFLSCSSAVILLLFIRVGAASSNFTQRVASMLISFRAILRVFSASRSCPTYWLCSSPDHIYEQYYYKYIWPELQLVFSVSYKSRGVQIQPAKYHIMLTNSRT